MPNCTFQDKWLEQPEFKPWLSRDKLVHNAYCRICSRSIDIRSMGRTALISHMKGKKHEDKLKFSQSSPITVFTKNKPAVDIPSNSATHFAEVSTPKSQSTLSNFISKKDTLNAEILWALKCVDSNYSFSSQADIVPLFQRMFPNCEIAQSMSLGETKIMYMSCFGIAPYLTSLLERTTKDSPYVLLFDESLNKDLKKKQLDIHIRMWDYDKVKTRYYTSDFIGHSCASDVLDSFEEKVVNSIGLNNIVQLSMDGPNVNWAIFKKMQEKISMNFQHQLIDIGSCGLHTLHNSFKAAIDATHWGVSQILSALHTLFKDTPARREDYEKTTGQSMYSLSFYSHRWVENAAACQRALDIFPFMSQYIAKVEKRELKNPLTKSYEIVKEWISNPLSRTRLAFIISLARPIELFLTMYQGDQPMLPFMAKDLEKLLRGLMSRFIKQKTLEEANTIDKLLKVESKSEKVLKVYSEIDIGFVAEGLLKEAKVKKLISDKGILEFKLQCREILSTLIAKLTAKSPLKYNLVRHMSCLDPEEMINKEIDSNLSSFRHVLNILVSLNRAQINECDEILSIFRDFLECYRHSQEIAAFSKAEGRLDRLYYLLLNGKEKFTKLWRIINVLLLLSHGQATVERGFSVNRDTTQTNISQKVLISKRIIKDHLEHVGGLANIVVTQELQTAAQQGRKIYGDYLDRKRTEEERRQKCSKRKLAENDIDGLKLKKQKLEKEIEFLIQDADKTSEKAESLQSFPHLSKANAIRVKAKEKRQQLTNINVEIEEKMKLLGNL